MIEEQYTVEDLMDWIMMDLNNIKIKRACRQLGINELECNIDREDLLNKDILEIMADEFDDVRYAIYERMEVEAQMPENQMFGSYIPGDVWPEALIELNTIIDNIVKLLELLEA